MHIRLIPENGNPAQDGIDDLDLEAVPERGDVIEIEYADQQFTSYEVMKRRFRVNPNIQEGSAFAQRVALEVREIHSEAGVFLTRKNQ